MKKRRSECKCARDDLEISSTASHARRAHENHENGVIAREGPRGYVRINSRDKRGLPRFVCGTFMDGRLRSARRGAKQCDRCTVDRQDARLGWR